MRKIAGVIEKPKLDRENLTKAQKEYQDKLLPKHYIERLKDQRREKFELYETEDAQKALLKRQKR
jgi:hypothetical protein